MVPRSMDGKRQIESLLFSAHALRQMFARSISADDIRAVVDEGEVIASYADDKPYPSELLLGSPTGRPLHVVLAYNQDARTGYVLTAYVPDPKLWSGDHKTRRNP